MEAGLRLLPPIVIITSLSGAAGKLADRIGPRLQMILGPAIVATGVALLTTGGAAASYFKHFLPGLVILGGGIALLIAPLTKSALHVDPRFSGSASGFNNAIARIAALMAVAVLGAIMLSIFSSHLTGIITTSSLKQAEQGQILSQLDKLGGIVIPDTFRGTTRLVVRQAITDSFVYAFRWAMGISASLALTGALVSVRTIRNPKNTSYR